MTTKLTEAEVKSLPVCKLCGTYPTTVDSGIESGNVYCDNDTCRIAGNLTPAEWRLLMTPEAKGEILGHYVECFGCGWQSSTMATNAEAVAAWMEHQRTCPRRHSLKNEIASLQSKLAKSEERVKELEDKNHEESVQYNRLKDLLKSTEGQRDYLASAERSIVELETAYTKSIDAQLSRIDNLKQQLAEATKPVGDEELEKAVKEFEEWHKAYFTSLPGPTTQLIIRAARQRKPSGDAVKLAEMVKDFAEISSSDWYHKYKCKQLHEVVKPLVVSILAQAGETKPTEGHSGPIPPQIAASWRMTTKQKECDHAFDKEGDNAECIYCRVPYATVVAFLASTEGVARVPAADLLTAEARADVEVMRLCSSRLDLHLSTDRLKRLVVLFDRLSPAPSAATPTLDGMLPHPCFKCGVCDGNHNPLVQYTPGKWEYPKSSAATTDPFATWGKYKTDWMISPAPMGYAYLYHYGKSAWMFDTAKWKSFSEMTSTNEADWAHHNPGATILSESEARAFLAQHPLPEEMQ